MSLVSPNFFQALHFQLCWKTSKALEKWAFHFSNQYISVRSILSSIFLILISKFRWVGSWRLPQKNLFFHIHGVSEMTTPRGVIGHPKDILSFLLHFSLTSCKRETSHNTICCHNFSADENDQNANAVCGIAITLLVDSFGKMIQINSLN